MKKHEKIALNRLRLLPVSETSSLNEALASRAKAVFLAELRSMGYHVENHEAFNGSILNNYKTIVKVLKKMRGGDVDYVPLFGGFPNDIPDTGVFVNQMDLWLGKHIGLFEKEEDSHILSNGMVVPSWFFGADGFGADSFGRQTEELYEKGVANQKAREGDDHVEWITLRFADATTVEQEVKQWLANNLYSKSSLKEALKPDLEHLMGHFDVNFVNADRVTFKETKAYVMAFLWNKRNWFGLSKFVSTPTDLLRMFAALTDSDISLAEPVRFPKMNRGERRFVLGSLDRFGGDLAENLNDYKGLWIALGKGLHPGEFKNKFKSAFDAFSIIRNKSVQTFESKVNRALDRHKLTEAMELLRSRPGVFARKIHQVLEQFPARQGVVLDNFSKTVNKVQLKNLLVLESYFKTIGDRDTRAVINKKGKIVVLPNKKDRIKPETTDKIVGLLGKTIQSKLDEKFDDSHESTVEEDGEVRTKRVWIDPALKGFTIPLQQRKMSDGLLSYGRGSRIPFDDKKVLRLFTYWHDNEQRTDLDLSLVSFDKNMKYLGHVSYTQLHGDGMQHSGDITSAPQGAAEFIDIRIDKIDKKAHYLAPQIYRFSGDNFFDLKKSYAGWMFRDKVNKTRKSFDIKTVSQKFNMVGSGQYAIPMVVDVQNKEIVMTDIYVSGMQLRTGRSRWGGNNVEGALNNVSTIAAAAVDMVNTRPNMHDLVRRYAQAEKYEIVKNKADADFSYGISDCDFTVDRVDEILSKML